MITRQADAHLAPFLAHRFNLTVAMTACSYPDFVAYKGDYDHGDAIVSDKTIFATALEFGSCYDGELFDKLVAIELGA